MNLKENLNEELIEALKNIYPIRDNLRKTLMETYNEELLDKLNALNKMIENAEILINKSQDVKKFYTENADSISMKSTISTKKLGYIKKN